VSIPCPSSVPWLSLGCALAGSTVAAPCRQQVYVPPLNKWEHWRGHRRRKKADGVTAARKAKGAIIRFSRLRIEELSAARVQLSTWARTPEARGLYGTNDN